MKLLFVSPLYYPNIKGGSEVTVKIIAEELVKRGLEVSVLSFDSPVKKIDFINKVKVIRVPKPRIKPGTLSINLALLLNKDVVKKEKPNIIHIYNTWNIPSGFFLKGIAPVVATLNNYFPLCPIDYTKNNLVESGDFSFFNMVKSIYKTREGSFVGRFFSAIFYTVYNRITLPFSRRIDNYIVYADSIKEIYLKGKFDRDKFYRVSNLIKFDKLVSNKSREKNVLLFVGDFSYAKGFRELVEALMLLKDKDVKLWVAGSGNGEEYFKDFTKKNKLNIKFYGWVDKEKTKKLYQSASLLIHPSQWPEPFSRVWLEAINNEIPIISSDNPCALEILKDCAVFYHRGHPEELRDKIKEALNSKKRINFKKVKNGLDFDKTIDRLIYVYNKIKRDKK